MSWLQKRKDRNQIPPVESDGGNSSSYLNSSSPSDPYSSRSATASPSINSYVDTRDRYQRNQPIDTYSRGQGNLDNDRRELFSGVNPEKANSGRFKFDGP